MISDTKKKEIEKPDRYKLLQQRVSELEKLELRYQELDLCATIVLGERKKSSDPKDRVSINFLAATTGKIYSIEIPLRSSSLPNYIHEEVRAQQALLKNQVDRARLQLKRMLNVPC